MDADWIANDATGPTFLIRENSRITLDGRFPLWDPPRTSLAEACRYHLVDTSSRWLLLRRGPDQCGNERSLGSVTVTAGQQVPVPVAPDGIVVVRVHPDQDLGQTLKALAFRPGELWLSVDGESHRLPWGHTDAPLMISAPGDPSLMLGGRELAGTMLSMNLAGRIDFAVVSTH
jgi:hypothetical protein